LPAAGFSAIIQAELSFPDWWRIGSAGRAVGKEKRIVVEVNAGKELRPGLSYIIMTPNPGSIVAYAE
jgi:hypothetical protein